ncbi:ion channel [Acaryochloris sp. IP29b_bin.148]|uniref:ion channel n=1 Tax=Acaryochloris sp. IP29b_bin.148 TaxID=2969218 RepID=UPI0026177066|nr:ion channel [Acaryochloris sp. IP29b_bin.148]
MAAKWKRQFFDSRPSFLIPTHFSLTTLTTLGFGDVVPISPLAIVLTDTEAIIGQLYYSVYCHSGGGISIAGS